MEKLTAFFCLLLLIGTLWVTASASGPNGTSEPSSFNNSSRTGSRSITTSANITEVLTTTTTSVLNGTNNTNHFMDHSEVNSTTPSSVSEATPDTDQTPNGNNTIRPYVPRSTKTTSKANRTMGDKQTPDPEKQPPPPIPSTRSTTRNTQKTSANRTTKGPKHSESNATTTYVIIFVIVILCLVGAIGYCCYQNKTRTFSLDQNSKNEEAHIPLSAVEPEVFEPGASKDLETPAEVESGGAPAEEKKGEQKAPAEATQQEKESSAEGQASVALGEKPGELMVVDLNDGDQAISNKTSVETLEETPNENNSNNRALASGVKTGLTFLAGSGGSFTEISLDDLL